MDRRAGAMLKEQEGREEKSGYRVVWKRGKPSRGRGRRRCSGGGRQERLDVTAISVGEGVGIRLSVDVRGGGAWW